MLQGICDTRKYVCFLKLSVNLHVITDSIREYVYFLENPSKYVYVLFLIQ